LIRQQVELALLDVAHAPGEAATEPGALRRHEFQLLGDAPPAKSHCG
jgi:hypothetical protein